MFSLRNLFGSTAATAGVILRSAGVLLSLVGGTLAAPSGGVPGQFLNFGAGARALAMGKAFIGIADDASAAYWNPAGLVQLERKELTALHTVLFGGASYDFLAYAHPTTSQGTFAGSLTRLASGTGDLLVPVFENAAEQTGNIVGEDSISFSDTQMAFGASYAKDLHKKVALGLSAKYILRSLKAGGLEGKAGSDTFLGMDLGVLGRDVAPGLRVALVLANLAAFKMKGETTDKLPITIKLGFSYKTLKDRLVAALDFDKPAKANMSVRFGLEYWALKFLAVRLGADMGDGGVRETAFGLGTRYSNFSLDMAFAFHALGISPRFSASWRFGRSVKIRQLELVQEFFRKAIEDYRNGNYLRALEFLSKANDVDPRNEEVKKQLDNLKRVAGQIQSETSATKEGDAIRRGIELYIRGDWRAAATTLKYAYDLAPAHAALLSILNDTERRIGAPLTTPVQAEVKVPVPTLVEELHAKAQDLFYQEKYDRAIEVYQEILRLEPQNVLALVRMGSCFYQLDLKEKAKATWKKVLEFDPTNKEVLDILRVLEPPSPR